MGRMVARPLRTGRGRPDAGVHHQSMAELLAEECDLLLCETFANVGEAVAATRAAVATGRPTWVALTAGPDADLLTVDAFAEAAKRMVDEGAEALLLNCTPAAATLPYIEDIASLAVPIGAYANAGRADPVIGWQSDDAFSAERYAKYAQAWADAGASIVGACCGTTLAHLEGLREQFGETA